MVGREFELEIRREQFTVIGQINDLFFAASAGLRENQLAIAQEINRVIIDGPGVQRSRRVINQMETDGRLTGAPYSREDFAQAQIAQSERVIQVFRASYLTDSGLPSPVLSFFGDNEALKRFLNLTGVLAEGSSIEDLQESIKRWYQEPRRQHDSSVLRPIGNIAGISWLFEVGNVMDVEMGRLPQLTGISLVLDPSAQKEILLTDSPKTRWEQIKEEEAALDQELVFNGQVAAEIDGKLHDVAMVYFTPVLAQVSHQIRDVRNSQDPASEDYARVVRIYEYTWGADKGADVDKFFGALSSYSNNPDIERGRFETQDPSLIQGVITGLVDWGSLNLDTRIALRMEDWEKHLRNLGRQVLPTSIRGVNLVLDPLDNSWAVSFSFNQFAYANLCIQPLETSQFDRFRLNRDRDLGQVLLPQPEVGTVIDSSVVATVPADDERSRKKSKKKKKRREAERLAVATAGEFVIPGEIISEVPVPKTEILDVAQVVKADVASQPRVGIYGFRDVVNSLEQDRVANRAFNILAATTTALLLAVGLCALINYERPIVAEIEKGRVSVQAMIDAQLAELLTDTAKMSINPILGGVSPQYPSMPWSFPRPKPAFGWFGSSTYAKYRGFLHDSAIDVLTVLNNHKPSRDADGLTLPSRWDFAVFAPEPKDSSKDFAINLNRVPDSSTIELIFKQDLVASQSTVDPLKEQIGDANFFPQEGDDSRSQRARNNYSLRRTIGLANRIRETIKLPEDATFLPDANLDVLSVFGTNTKGQTFKIKELLQSSNNIRIEINKGKVSPDQDPGQNSEFIEALNKLREDVKTKPTVLRDKDIDPLVDFLNEKPKPTSKK